MKRTKFPIKIGEYIVLIDRQYEQLLEVLDQGTFHTSGSPEIGWKIRIIDERVKLGLELILK